MRKISISLLMSFCLIFCLAADSNGQQNIISQAREITSFEQMNVGEVEKEIFQKSLSLPEEIFRIPDRPHHLQDITQIPESSYERLIELNKVYQMKKEFYDDNGGLYIDKAVEKLGLHKNKNYLQLTSEIEVAGRKILVIYPLHLLSDPVNKEFIYMSPLGPKNLAEFSPFYRKYEIQWATEKISNEKWVAIKRALGWAQFQAVKDFLYDYIEKALAWDVEIYKGLPGSVLKNQANLLEDPLAAEKMSNPVPGLNGHKIKDVLLLPRVKIEDFSPDILVFGPLKWAWGLANWKTPGSERIVFYDFIASAYDFIRGSEPLVLAHELVHTNPYLQGTPTDLYFNVEMWTALTTDFADDLMYFGNYYLYVPTDTVHTYFGYDRHEARKRIWPYRFVSLRDFRREEYKENIKRIQETRTILLDFVINDFFPTFYADPYLWNTVNTKWCDTAAVWRILMSFKFEPCILFDPKKIDPETNKPFSPCVQTKQWLEEQEQAGKIKKLADEAMKKTGELTDYGKEMSKIEDYAGFIKCPSDSGWFSMPPDEQKKTRAMIKQLIEENDPRFIRAMLHYLNRR